MCTMSNTDEHTPSCKLFNFLVCGVLIGIICFAGLVGNATSFLVLLKHKTETSAIYLLQCMAVADSLLLITTLLIYSFPTIYPYTEHMKGLWDACEAIKEYVWPLAMMTHTATIWMTVLVTLNRFGAICRPIGSFRKQGTDGVRLQVVGVIIFSVLYNLPRFFEHRPIKYVSHNLSHNGVNGTGKNVTYEPFNLGDSQIYQIIYSNVLYFPVMYVVPLLSLAYLNYRLIKSLKAIKEKKETLTGHRPREDHITECIIVIVCVFIVCQTPALANQIFWAALDQTGRACGRFHFYYTKLSDALVVLNSSCNFVIYCLFGKSFRKIFLDTLCKERMRNREREGTCMDELEVTNGDVRKKSGETCVTDAV